MNLRKKTKIFFRFFYNVFAKKSHNLFIKKDLF